MANCCSHVTGFTDSVRFKLKRTILEYEKTTRLEGKQPAHSLQTQLFDQFSECNKDWRRLAITEAGEMANQGMIASMPEGQKMKRLEQYAGPAIDDQFSGWLFDFLNNKAAATV